MQANQDDDTPLSPSWSQRPKPVGFEITYRLRGDTLEIDTTRKVDHVRLGSVEQVRFIYAPSNVTAKAYKAQLRLSDGKVITFGNLSWRSLTDISRDDARYHAFVTALSQTIARANPKARFIAGKPYALWVALAVVSALSMVMLAFFSARAFQQGASSAGWLGLGLIGASVWQVWPMVKLNKPRQLASGEVPDELVPGRPGPA